MTKPYHVFCLIFNCNKFFCRYAFLTPLDNEIKYRAQWVLAELLKKLSPRKEKKNLDLHWKNGLGLRKIPH